MNNDRHELVRERVQALEALCQYLGVDAASMTTGAVLDAARPPVPAPKKKRKKG